MVLRLQVPNARLQQLPSVVGYDHGRDSSHDAFAFPKRSAGMQAEGL